jgi:hypothetical protein
MALYRRKKEHKFSNCPSRISKSTQYCLMVSKHVLILRWMQEWWNDVEWGNRSNITRTCSTTSLLSKNPHSNWPASNPGLHDEMLYHVNLGTAMDTKINPHFILKFRSYRGVNTILHYENCHLMIWM